MKVTAHEILRAQIRSSKPPWINYTIDLVSYNGTGRCTCPDFECSRWPDIRDGARPSDAVRCKHIKYLRGQLADTTIFLLWEAHKDRAYDLLEFSVVIPTGTVTVNLLERGSHGSCTCSVFKETGDCDDIAACRSWLVDSVIRKFIKIYGVNDDS